MYFLLEISSQLPAQRWEGCGRSQASSQARGKQCLDKAGGQVENRYKSYQFLTNEKNRIMILTELLIMEYQARNPVKIQTGKVLMEYIIR